MENINREVGVVYTSSSFSLNKNTVHISLVRDYIEINKLDKTYLNYNIMDKLLEKCKNKNPNDTKDVIILKNYSFLRIYLRSILLEIIEPLICNFIIKDSDEIIITGLETIDDQIVNIIQIVTENSDSLYNTYGIKLKHTIILKEKERF